MSKEIIISLVCIIIILIILYIYNYNNSRFIKTEILFGRNFIDDKELSENEFNIFVDEIVAKYFPYGFTVTTSRGQMFDGNKIVKQRNLGIYIIHKNNYIQKENIEKIIQTFRKKYKDLQITKFQENVSVEFYNRS